MGNYQAKETRVWQRLMEQVYKEDGQADHMITCINKVIDRVLSYAISIITFKSSDNIWLKS